MPKVSMTQTVRLRALPALALALLAAIACAASASAHSAASAGGAGFEEPKLSAIRCGTGDETSCPRGHVLRLSGEGLAQTRKVTFLGERGSRDDRTARPAERSPHRVIVSVPRSARSGPIRVVTATAAATGPHLRVLAADEPATTAAPAAPSTKTAPDGGVFPVRGQHDYGTEINRFGGGRGHKGQDVFAQCGTPMVAALGGVVTFKKFQERAGNYVVIKADDGTGHAYMHLAAPAIVDKGDRVAAGQPIGEVGDTGRASGCHLHFELWTAPGWYEGGSAIDPLPALQRWDAAG
jgi:murein DD-endopeptidase MepM/ murein hydrolase activator NlpD